MTKDSIKKEKVFRIKQEAWRKNPLLWLADRFGEPEHYFRWSQLQGYKGHKWDGDEDGLMQAWLSVAAGSHTAIEAGTGTSKTFMLSRVVFWFLDCWKDSLVVTSAPKEAQLKLNLWAEIGKASHKFRKLRPGAQNLQLKLRVDAGDKGGKKTNQFIKRRVDEEDLTDSWQAIGFVAGEGAEEESANKARGFHREHMLFIIEETPGMSNAVMNAFKNTCTDTHNIILAVGNPDNELDQLHRFGSLDYVNNFRISAYDYPNVVLGKSIFPGGVSQKSIDERATEYGVDSGMYNRMVRGLSPSEATDSLIKLSWIKACVDNFDIEDDGSFNGLGIDVANSEAGDKAALAWGKSNTLVSLQNFYCNNATHLAYNIILNDEILAQEGYSNYNTEKADEYNLHADCIGVDAVGVGAATVNAFVDNGWRISSLHGGQWDEAIPKDHQDKPLYRFNSLRSQMYWELREDIRRNRVTLAINDKEMLNKLKTELTAPKFEISAMTIQVESKEKIKKRLGRSPDLADAVVYWNFVRKGHRKQVDIGMFA